MATDSHRMESGGRIDRSNPIKFQFNGKNYTGYSGDTLASALLANNVHLTARSFKYHRPRGIISAGCEEPGTLVELLEENSSGNRAITSVRIEDGLKAKSVNCWPSPDFDLGGINQFLADLLPAGFYYKTFMWPNWRLYEPLIRRAAGLAGAPASPPTKVKFESRHAHVDVLVVGAGPAGLLAALHAGRSGSRVMLVDENSEAGGALLNRKVRIGGESSLGWVSSVVDELAAMKNVMHIQSATAWGIREHNLVLVLERRLKEPGELLRNWRVRAARTVVATGSTERSLVFANNDRPGVMLSSAAQSYVNRYAVIPGRKALIFTNNSSAFSVAADLMNAGIEIAAIVDSRREVQDADRSHLNGIEILPGSVVSEAHGHRRVNGATVSERSESGRRRRIDCDLLLHSGGWNPTVNLYSQSRGDLRFDDCLAAFVPVDSGQAVMCAGAANGRMTIPEAIADGAKTGIRAAIESGYPGKSSALPEVDEDSYSVEALWHVEPRSRRNKCFVDFLNDVTVEDIRLALREGYRNVEQVKRYTTGGMGFDQGKTGNINIVGTIAQERGLPLSEFSTTTFRSPYTPVEFGSIGGTRSDTVFLPYRHTPVTSWNTAQGAVMYEAGARWRRPGYFPKPGETMQEAVSRESRAVRVGVGVYDGSPLGKFELKGRDAAKLLDFVYTNFMSDLAPGHGRYGMMLSDDGLIFDDGVVFCLSKSRFLVTTSTANAETVNRHLEFILQIERPEWDIKLTAVTSQWSNATICGPKAREVVRSLETDIDLDTEKFPFMAWRKGRVAGIDARIFRVSFTGELSFEINVASRDFDRLWNKIIEKGSTYGIEPVGSEANHVLRTEKGFLSLGHEVDGTVDPYDLGMGWIMSKKKPDFIGRRSVELRRQGSETRRELVGLLPDDPDKAIPEGAPLTPGGRKTRTEGFVSACVWSVVKERWIALALLERGRERMGQIAHARVQEEIIQAKIVSPCFHDSEGQRLRS
ncbi:MAG: sarcosine oxidase subunit alpha family protein [Albidovulum sp.]|nr:sarcosine oxidase subunit alpha family protein [Albidovulum sp.]